MSVEEYLRILNGVFDNNKLTPDLIDMMGLIDIIPGIGDIPDKGMGPLELYTDSENIIVKRTYYTEYGDIPVSRTTSLSDDISLHGEKNETSEQLIEKTIKALQEIMKRELAMVNRVPVILSNYQPRIDAFYNALENIKQNPDLTSGHIRK